MRNKYNKCQTEFICFENITLIIGIVIIFSIGYLIYKSSPINLHISETDIKNQQNQSLPQPNQINVNNYGDYATAYSNPYYPPLKNESYLVPIPVVSINQPTNVGYVPSNYSQVGILTPVSQTTKDNILPLMGRPLLANRSKFQYYTISNQHNNVKLPVSVNGKSGLSEYGVDELFDGDTVYVEGYEDVFKVTKYENGTLRYLPLI